MRPAERAAQRPHLLTTDGIILQTVYRGLNALPAVAALLLASVAEARHLGRSLASASATHAFSNGAAGVSTDTGGSPSPWNATTTVPPAFGVTTSGAVNGPLSISITASFSPPLQPG